MIATAKHLPIFLSFPTLYKVAHQSGTISGQQFHQERQLSQDVKDELMKKRERNLKWKNIGANELKILQELRHVHTIPPDSISKAQSIVDIVHFELLMQIISNDDIFATSDLC